MQKLGLSQQERRAFHRALRSSHEKRVLVSVTDLDGDVLSTVNHRVLDGQVVVDYTADVTRSLTLQLLDPDHSLNFDTDSPDPGALYADRMIRVHYSVKVEELGRWVSVPVFHGPVTKLDRKGDVVDIEAQGKEALAMGVFWRPLTLKKGTSKTDAIRTILRERTGERRFAIPDLAERLPKARSYDRYAVPWKAAQRIAGSIGKDDRKQLFYDGAGIATLRTLPEKPVWTFRPGTGGDVVSDIGVSYSMEEVINTVVVLGKKTGKDRVQGLAVAENTHALSPRRLGRTNRQGEFVPRHLVERVEAENIRTKEKADERAKRILNDRLRQVVEVTFDALPIPHLEPGDLVAVEFDHDTIEFRLKQFTIPLGTSGNPVMSVGYHRKTTINRRRIRRR